MREPPDDNALWPRLIWFAFTFLFTIAVVLIVWGFTVRELAPPPSSTLVPLQRGG